MMTSSNKDEVLDVAEKIRIQYAKFTDAYFLYYKAVDGDEDERERIEKATGHNEKDFMNFGTD